MKKTSYGLCILTALASFGLSSCQAPSSIMDSWPSDWSDDANSKPSNVKTTPATTTTTTVTSQAPIVSKKGVVVPQSYYLAEGTPVSHQASDTDWVDEQDSEGYTIQLANGSAPAVAQTLQQAPKSARMAQVQYNNNGQTGYVGVYGTYATKAEAEAALSKLPSNLQSSAQVESWSDVQEKVVSAPTTSSEDTIAPPDMSSMSQ
jgi:septal ring-binding cell division protein DamX